MWSVLIASAVVASLGAPPEEQDVLAAVQQFFDTMASKNVEGAAEVLVPVGRMFSVRTVDGKKVVRSSTNQEYLARLGRADQDWLERMWEPEVRVHGDIATVWTAYDFHVNGEFSHCGVDAFDMVRVEGAWKIAGAVYTVETDDCEPSPLGPP